MSELNNYIAAVDLGTTKVAIAVARKVEGGKVEVLSLKETISEGVIKGDLKNLEQAAAAVREVKAKVEAELKIKIKEVLVGISGQHIKSINDTGNVFVQTSNQGFSEVTAEDVENLTSLMHRKSIEVGKTIINVLPQIYKVDEEGDILQPVGMEGKRLEAKFNIVIGDETAIERVRRCFERAGLVMLPPVLQPLASAEAVLSDDEKELGVAVVDIGGGTTDLCIYYDKIIRHIAVIPIGGNIVNKDIKSIGVLNKHIEKLKTTFGEAIAEKTPAEKYIKLPSVSGQPPKEIPLRILATIIQERMYDIIEYVKFEIEKGTSGVKLGAGIVLTGGGANLKNLDQLFRNQLGMQVRVASPSAHLTPESAEMMASPKYSTLSGILVDALMRGVNTYVEPMAVDEYSQEQDYSSSSYGQPQQTSLLDPIYQDEQYANPQQNTPAQEPQSGGHGSEQQGYYDDNSDQGYAPEQNYEREEYDQQEDYEPGPELQERPKKSFSKRIGGWFKKMTSDDEIDDQDY